MTKGFWERNVDAFCESYVPNQYQEEEALSQKAWNFSLSLTIIVIGIIACFKFF